MKNWILCLALVVAGCNGCGGDNTGGGNTGGGNTGGGNTNAYVGTWKGDVSGWSVSLVVKEATDLGGTYTVTGTATTNKASCFGTGNLSGTITPEAGATLNAEKSGDASTNLFIEGPVANGKITGYFEVQSETPECVLARTAATFTRQ